MSNSFFFDSVWFLESLPPHHQFAKEIVNGLRAHAVGTGLESRIHYRAVDSSSAFMIAMDAIARDAADNHHSPILQLNVHGSEDGFAFSSSEFVTWDQVGPIFSKINAVTRLNLMVLMAACDGASLLKMVDPSRPAPLWGLIGPIREITIGEALKAYPAFFKEVFASLDGAKGWRRMNAAIDKGDQPFGFFSCSTIFRRVFEGYHATECTPEALATRLAKIERIARGSGVSAEQIVLRRPTISAALRNFREPFEHFKRQFFMLDRFPEHRERFPLTFEECAATSVGKLEP